MKATLSHAIETFEPRLGSSMERAANLLKVGAKISRVRLTRHHPSRSKRRRARLPSFAMMRVVLSASADARALTVSPSSRRATRGLVRSSVASVCAFRTNRRLSRPYAPSAFRARLPPVRASDSYADETDDALEVFGFSEAWEVEMVRFWRDWNASEARHRVRDLDIKWLVALGRTDRAFARPEIVAEGARKLASLLPDANVPNMLQREPKIVDLNFVRASRSIMELQEVLCDVDKCTDVTPVLERHPRLLMCEDVRGEVEAAKARLHELAPACDAAKAVNEYPELSA